MNTSRFLNQSVICQRAETHLIISWKKNLVKLFKKKNNEILINLKKFKNHNNEIKMAIINASIKKLKKNYYDSRAKKVTNLIKTINKKGFKKSTLGGCIFFKKGINLCLKNEKL